MLKRIRHNTDVNFVVVPNDLLRDATLSLQAKGLLSLVMGLPDKWEFSMEGTMVFTKEKRCTVIKVMNELKAAGLCQVVSRRAEDGRILGWDYYFRFNINEEWDLEPQSKKPQCGKSTIWENHNVENQTQKNIDSKGTKTIKNKEKEVEEELLLPFHSARFLELWDVLRKMPNWKKKPVSALQMSLKKISKFEEEFVITLMEDAIAGNWKGLVFADTADRYETWKKNRATSTAKSKEITMEDL